MITWIAAPNAYHGWSEQQRADMETFLRAHGVDPGDVLINNAIHICRTEGGEVLELWVVDREDGNVVNCPTCPCCARQKRLVLDLVTQPPLLPGAYRYAAKDET